jgi:hypothetical protein
MFTKLYPNWFSSSCIFTHNLYFISSNAICNPMLNIYVSKPFQQSKQISNFKLYATHFERCLHNCAQKFILLLMCFHPQFMFRIFKCKMQPHVKFLCFQTFPKKSKQSPIQARFLKHCHLGKPPSQFHFQVKTLNLEFIWLMGCPPLLDKHIIIHNIEKRMDIPLILYLPFWTLYDVTQYASIHHPLGKLGMKLVNDYGIHPCDTQSN